MGMIVMKIRINIAGKFVVSEWIERLFLISFTIEIEHMYLFLK
jgi:hypothetical protein